MQKSAPMLSLLQGRWRKPMASNCDQVLTLLGPEFSGKTLIYETLVGSKASVPSITYSSAIFKYKASNFCLYDIAGNGKSHRMGTGSLANCVDAHKGAAIFVHDAANGNLDTSLELLDTYMKELVALKVRYVFVVLNKQDLMLATEARWTKIQKLTYSFETRMSKYNSQIIGQVFRFDGFTGGNETYCKFLLDEIMCTFRHFGSFRPLPPIQPVSVVRQELQKLEEEPGFNSKLDSETFWLKLKDGTLVLESHLDRLRATYLTVLDAMVNKQDMLDLVQDMQQLEESRASGEGCKQHRTMVMFWVLMFRSIIQQMSSEDGGLPAADLSLEVAKQYQYSLGPDVWKKYYTERLMQDPKTAIYWRLPDIRKISAPATARYSIPSVFKPQDDENDRIPRFAFAIVKSYMGFASPSQRWIVEQALAVLQSAIMRTRAADSTITPFSETQAFFWIEYMHSILSKLSYFEPNIDIGYKMPKLPSVVNLEFDDFLAVGLAQPGAWRDFYSYKTWYSMDARIKRVQPDLKPLDFYFNLSYLFLRPPPVVFNLIRPELPSDEELTLYKLITEKRIGITDLTSLVHSHLLYMIFCQLVHAQNLDNRDSCVEETTEFFAKKGNSLSSIPFWTKLVWERLHIRLVSTREAWRANTSRAFSDFLISNMDLLHEGLWKGLNSLTEKLSGAQSQVEEKSKEDDDAVSILSEIARVNTPMSQLSESEEEETKSETDADTLSLKSNDNKDWEVL